MNLNEDSTSWMKSLKGSLKSIDELNSFFNTSFPKTYQPVFIPHAIALKIKKQGIESALGRQFLPCSKENTSKGLIDPIGDQVHSPENGIIHRYKNRILFFPTTACPIQCRYCFRKNELHERDSWIIPKLDKTIEYLKAYPEVNEVIFSGGDPLILSTEKLKRMTTSFLELPQIKFLRFHTRTPSTLPERIDKELLQYLRELSTKVSVSLVIHTNHPDEIDQDVDHHWSQLRDLPIHLHSQTVLLKGVNDNAFVLKELFQKLTQYRIQPYYLHHPDQVKGAMHFYLSLKEGRVIYQKLKSQVSGWMLPRYVIDLPEGHGKVNAYNPESLEFSGLFLDRQGVKRPYVIDNWRTS